MSARALVFASLFFVTVGCHSSPADAPSPDGGTPPAGGSSAERIDAAEASGALDHDTAQLYRLYALYDREDLPAEYLGVDDDADPPDASAIFRDVAPRFDMMSPALQAKFTPFRLPPNNPESVWAHEHRTAASTAALTTKSGPSGGGFIGWTPVDTGDTHVLFWKSTYATDDDIKLVTKVVDKSWDFHKSAMLGKEPCADTNLTDHGPDGRLDVFVGRNVVIWPRKAESLKKPAIAAFDGFKDKGCPGPGFVIADAGKAADQFEPALSHELFHAFQGAYPGYFPPENDWWCEASATWAADLTYPDNPGDYPRGFLAQQSGFMGTLSHPTAGPLDSPDANREYGNFIWPFYMTSNTGGAKKPEYVGQIWSALGGTGSPSALQAFMAEPDFATRFKEFLVWNINDHLAPITQNYHDNGALIPYRVPIDKTTLGSSSTASETASFDVNLPEVSAGYHWYDIEDGADVTTQVEFDFSRLGAAPARNVQAVVMYPDRWVVEDWSGETNKKFCRTDKDQNIQSVILVVANLSGSKSDVVKGKVGAKASIIPCKTDKATLSYSGTMTWTKADLLSGATGMFTYSESVDSVLDIALVGHDDALGLISYQVKGAHTIKVNGSGSLSGGTSGISVSESDQLIGSGTVHTPAAAGDYWPWKDNDPTATWPLTFRKDTGEYELSILMPGVKLTRKAEKHTTVDCGPAGTTKDDEVWDSSLNDFVTTHYDCMSKMTTTDTPPAADPIYATWSLLGDDVLVGKVPASGPIDVKVTNTVDCTGASVIGGYDMDTSLGPSCSITYTARFTFDPPDRWK